MPVSLAIRAARQARYDRRMAKAAKIVPDGLYCYTLTGEFQAAIALGQTITTPKTARCPYWRHRADKRQQQSGFCRLLRSGDGTPMRKSNGQRIEPTMLLWDQVKECGVNIDDETD